MLVLVRESLQADEAASTSTRSPITTTGSEHEYIDRELKVQLNSDAVLECEPKEQDDFDVRQITSTSIYCHYYYSTI